jgi:hypothetical protein
VFRTGGGEVFRAGGGGVFRAGGGGVFRTGGGGVFRAGGGQVFRTGGGRVFRAGPAGAFLGGGAIGDGGGFPILGKGRPRTLFDRLYHKGIEKENAQSSNIFHSPFPIFNSAEGGEVFRAGGG